MLLKVKTIFIAVHGLEEFLNFSNFLKLSLGEYRVLGLGFRVIHCKWLLGF
jgi:hypothetical protein